MRNISLALLFLSISTLSLAQNSEFAILSKSVTCASIDRIIGLILDPTIDEKPIWRGKSEDNKSDFVVVVNSKTKSFTIIQYNKTHGCILGLGNKAESFMPDRFKD